jgi:ATP-dependent protease HslVU (ClpYQ) peptidase subunit
MRSVARLFAAAKRPRAAEAARKAQPPAAKQTMTLDDLGIVFNPQGLDLGALEADMVRCVESLTVAEEKRALLERIEDQLQHASSQLVMRTVGAYKDDPAKEQSWLRECDGFVTVGETLLAQVQKHAKECDAVIENNVRIIEEAEGTVIEVSVLDKQFQARVADHISSIYNALEKLPEQDRNDEDEDEEDDEDEDDEFEDEKEDDDKKKPSRRKS